MCYKLKPHSGYMPPSFVSMIFCPLLTFYSYFKLRYVYRRTIVLSPASISTQSWPSSDSFRPSVSYCMYHMAYLLPLHVLEKIYSVYYNGCVPNVCTCVFFSNFCIYDASVYWTLIYVFSSFYFITEWPSMWVVFGKLGNIDKFLTLF